MVENKSAKQIELEALVYNEQEAARSTKRALELLIEGCESIHHWGDGDFGYIRELLEDAITKYKNGSGQAERDYYMQLMQQENNPKAQRKDLSYNLRKKVFESNAYRCVNCDSFNDLTVDHIHPVSKGGTNDLDNLQTLCKPCNSSKGVKTMDEWLGGAK